LTYEAVRRTLGPVVRALYRLEVRGQDLVPPAGPLVVASNHESVLDPFVLSSAIPRALHYVAKAELWRYPVLHWWLDEMGAVPVARGRGDLRTIARAQEVLERGEVVALFPEGRVRSQGPWLRGAARLALATGAPLLPVRMLGTAEALSRGRIGLPRVAVLIGEPIRVEPAPGTIAAARVLTVELRAAVAGLGG
jgi:1-acyl-sn-glycerol-3-phosphate acyltransferase